MFTQQILFECLLCVKHYNSGDLEVNKRQIFSLFQDSLIPYFTWLIYTCLHNSLLLRKKKKQPKISLFTHGKYKLKVLVHYDYVTWIRNLLKLTFLDIIQDTILHFILEKSLQGFFSSLKPWKTEVTTPSKANEKFVHSLERRESAALQQEQQKCLLPCDKR